MTCTAPDISSLAVSVTSRGWVPSLGLFTNPDSRRVPCQLFSATSSGHGRRSEHFRPKNASERRNLMCFRLLSQFVCVWLKESDERDIRGIVTTIGNGQKRQKSQIDKVQNQSTHNVYNLYETPNTIYWKPGASLLPLLTQSVRCPMLASSTLPLFLIYQYQIVQRKTSN